MDLSALALFAAVYFVAVASPGPGMAAIVARGLGQGLAAAPAFIAGFVVGDLVLFALAASGLAMLARTFETAFLVVKYAGCTYLLWMAWRIWTAPVKSSEVRAAAGRVRAWPSFLGTLSLTLGNPKAIVFFASIMPLVVDLREMTPLIFAELGVVIVLVITPVLTAALLLANRARRLFTSEKALKRINRLTGGLMGGAALAIAARS